MNIRRGEVFKMDYSEKRHSIIYPPVLYEGFDDESRNALFIFCGIQEKG